MKNRPCLRAAFVLIALLLLFAAGAAADSRHTFVLQCTGGGFAGRDSRGVKSEILVLPEAGFTDEDGNERTLEEIRALPDFRPEGAALRFTADSVQGWELRYALICGGAVSAPQAIRPGRNLWDVTAVLEKWLEGWTNCIDVLPLGQELDPITGKPTKASPWYSSGMLSYLNAAVRLGIVEGF